MFWPSKVVHTTVVVPQENKNSLILALHETGICQLEQSDSDFCFKQGNSEEEVKAVRGLELRLNELMNKIKPYRKTPQPENMIKKLFFPDEPEQITVELRKNDEIIREVKQKLDEFEEPITQKLSQITGKKEQLKEIENKISELSLLPDLPTSLFKPTENLSIITGAVTVNSIPEIEKDFKGKPFVALTHRHTKEKKLIFIFFPPEQEKEVNKTLHRIGLETFEIPYSKKKPSEQVNALEEEKQELKKQILELKEQLRKEAEVYRDLELLGEEIEVCRERIEALHKLGGGNSFSVLTAWVPQEHLEQFKQLVNEQAETSYMEIEEKEDAPTILKNPRLVKPFEMLINLYSPPKYGHLDPTPIMALTYAIFFGFMLTDAVYGFVLMIMAIGIARGIGKYNPGIRKFAEFLVIVGAFTAILGVLLGSYLGDLLQQMGWNIPQLLDPMKDIMILVAITAGIGVLHLTLGLILGVIDKVKQKDYMGAISDQGVWLVFVTGLILALGSMALESLMTPGIGLILLSAILKMAFVFKEEGLVSSVLSIFDFSGFVGDIFSYTRLMALAVGTAGIALAINFMALMVADLIPVLGIFIALIILLIGHTFNMAMNGLGSFVHGLRLHFLEFFTKFYDGGGKQYTPFYSTRKITKVKR